mgnify:CR=1 FL=1
MLKISIDSSDLQQAVDKLGLLTEKNIRFIVAEAMTTASKAAQVELQNSMRSGRYINNPTPFTLNSTYVRFARASDLTTEVGFKQFATKGTPAGRYLQHLVTGGPREAKRSEMRLRSSGVIGGSRFLVPTGVTPLKLNQYGNLPASAYTQVLSRLKAFNTAGATQNVSRAAASQAKRQQRDYFVGRPGGLPEGIYARVGRRPKGGGLPRGFHTVFYITNQPNYRPTFPIPSILNAAYERTFQATLPSLIEAELARKFQ